jgi:hypothetical protein
VAQNPNLDEAQNELQFFVRDLVHNSFFNKPESSESTGRIMANVLSCRLRGKGKKCLELLKPETGTSIDHRGRISATKIDETMGNHLVSTVRLKLLPFSGQACRQ